MVSYYKEYKWLTDKLEGIFGKDKIDCAEFNYGTEFGVAYKIGEKMLGFRVEQVKEYVPVKYSLNSDPNKDKVVSDMIDKFKKLELNDTQENN